MVTICSNTETLRPIWSDIYEAAGLTDSHDWDESVAVVWCKKFAELLDAAGIEWRYESSFEKWHGGPYSGTCHSNRVSDAHIVSAARAQSDALAVAVAVAVADAVARAAAQSDVVAMAESE